MTLRLRRDQIAYVRKFLVLQMGGTFLTVLTVGIAVILIPVLVLFLLVSALGLVLPSSIGKLIVVQAQRVIVKMQERATRAMVHKVMSDARKGQDNG